jgi:hypothetical protein
VTTPVIGVCLLPMVTLAGPRSEQRSLYQRPDGEWFLCKGQVCDQPVPPPAYAPIPERQQYQQLGWSGDVSGSSLTSLASLDHRVRVGESLTFAQSTSAAVATPLYYGILSIR